MNVFQGQIIVMFMRLVQILSEALLVCVIVVTLEMVFLVMVKFFFFSLILLILFSTQFFSKKPKMQMNVQQIMEDVHQMHCVQTQLEVSIVLVILDILEMVLHVLVMIF